MSLHFTNNQTPVREKTIYFDGEGDYGKITGLELSKYDAVTVEVCFREATYEGGMLFEYSKENVGGWDHDGVFYEAVNSNGKVTSKGEIHTAAKVGGYKDTAGGPSAIVDSARNFRYSADTAKLKTVTLVLSNENSTNGRMSFVNGQRGPDGTGVDFIGSNNYPTTKETTVGKPFGNWTFSVAARLTQTPSIFFKGEIAALRIYGRALNADEIAKNADEDKARFGRL
jgi:hypothetical protein